MAAKRKISIRKVLQALVTLIVTSGCIVAVLGASRLQQRHTLGQIFLHVKNEDKYLFINKQELWKDLIERKHIKAGKTRIEKLDVRSIERRSFRHPWVSDAEVYLDNRHNLHISVGQRIPVARVFMENGQSMYLDTSLNLLPLSDEFTYYTTIVSNVPVLGRDSLSQDMKAQVVRLVRFIEQDTFWNAQVQQIIVTPDRKFELIPVLGTHRILIGDTSGLKEKFNNVFAFYKKVLNRIGWDKYQVLDVRFKDQVVASPSLPWKIQSKNAISNMDWVKNIIGSEPRTDSGSKMKQPEPISTVADQSQKPPTETAPVVIAKTTAAKPALKSIPKSAAPKPVKKEVVNESKKEAAKPVKKVEKPAKALVSAAKTEAKKTKAVEKQENKKTSAKYIYQGNTNH
jgi:cell division protein FtsQ